MAGMECQRLMDSFCAVPHPAETQPVKGGGGDRTGVKGRGGGEVMGQEGCNGGRRGKPKRMEGGREERGRGATYDRRKGGGGGRESRVAGMRRQRLMDSFCAVSHPAEIQPVTGRGGGVGRV